VCYCCVLTLLNLLLGVIQHIIDGPSRKINQLSESIAIFQSAVVVPESKHYSGHIAGDALVSYEKLIALTLTGVTNYCLLFFVCLFVCLFLFSLLFSLDFFC
jgi:hypothetical protein